MTFITTFVTGIVNAITTNTPTGPTGANAVRKAVSEIEDLADKEFNATLAEPDIVQDEDVEYFNDPKIIVPILNSPFETVNQLVFDLPEGSNDEVSQFTDLLNVFGLDFDTMEQLAGKEVPITFIGGNASVVWEALEDDEPESITDPTKGTEENPHTKEDVEEVMEYASDDTKSTESNVTVEKTTISGDDADTEDDTDSEATEEDTGTETTEDETDNETTGGESTDE